MQENEENEIEPYENILKPQRFSEFIGQENLKSKLSVAMQASKERNEPLPHILLYSNGIGGGGKSTLAEIIGREFDVSVKVIIASSLANKADLLNILFRIEKNSILLLDEIHALRLTLQETIYAAMENFKITIKNHNNVMHLSINPFTLVGATTILGRLSQPLVSRFGICHQLEEYSLGEICEIIEKNSNKLQLSFESEEIIPELAKRCRGIPRLANRLLLRLRDYAEINSQGKITWEDFNECMRLEKIDSLGMDDNDRRYLSCLFHNFGFNCCGLNSISSILGDNRETIENSTEPFLLKNGFILKTSRGRLLTERGFQLAKELK